MSIQTEPSGESAPILIAFAPQMALHHPSSSVKAALKPVAPKLKVRIGGFQQALGAPLGDGVEEDQFRRALRSALFAHRHGNSPWQSLFRLDSGLELRHKD